MKKQIKLTNPALHRYLFTVTTFSKLLAMVLFIGLPFIGFYLGTQYQQKLTVATPVMLDVQKITQMPINTADWKTFGNDKFAIKYPSDWQVHITPLIGNLAPSFSPTSQDYPVLDVGYSALQDYTIPCDSLGLSESHITVNGLKAIECMGTTKTLKDGKETNITAQWKTIVIYGKDNKFTFNYRYSSNNLNSYYENLFSKFLQTFQIK